MTAISKAWVDIADGAVDPDSPIDTVLMTALRDNAIHMREWMGASFYAGAVQDHRHDGVDSALVPVGPNMLRNGSFEDGEGGWTFVNFTGGSHAISITNHRHGAKSAEFTSTVLANGGGEAVTNEFMLVGESEVQGFNFWIIASAINISSRVEVIWYDSTKAQISATTLQNYTNTPTTWTEHLTSATAPANARFFKVRITGGVPGAGSATGTIRFDGIGASNARIVQSQLKTTTAAGSVNVGSGAGATYTLTGGTYSWWTGSADTAAAGVEFGGGNQGAGVLGLYNHDGATAHNFYVDERYVQASPPWDLGDGEIDLFALALVDNLTSALRGVSVGVDPTWGNNGPAAMARREGTRGFRRVRMLEGMPLNEALQVAAVRDRFFKGESQIDVVEREITRTFKNVDMPQYPHPWLGNNLTGLTVVMLNPFTRLVDRLRLMLEDQGARELRDLIVAGHLTIGNKPLALNAPPGVMPVAASWKLPA